MSDFINNNPYIAPGNYPPGGDSHKGKANKDPAEPAETSSAAPRTDRPLDPDSLMRAYGQNAGGIRNEVAAQSIARSVEAFVNSPDFGRQIDFWDAAFKREVPGLDETQRALYVSELVLGRNGFQPALDF